MHMLSAKCQKHRFLARSVVGNETRGVSQTGRASTEESKNKVAI